MGLLTAHATGIVDAFNNEDWDATRKLFGDATYTEFGTQRSLRGVDEVLAALQAWKTAMPDVKGTVANAIENDQHVVLEMSWHGTHTGELVTGQGAISPSGKEQTTRSAFVFEFEDGELKEARQYFDLLSLLKQIGAA